MIGFIRCSEEVWGDFNSELCKEQFDALKEIVAITHVLDINDIKCGNIKLLVCESDKFEVEYGMYKFMIYKTMNEITNITTFFAKVEQMKEAIEVLTPEKPKTHTVKIKPATINGIKGYWVGGLFCEEMKMPENALDILAEEVRKEIDRELVEKIRKEYA